jgi:hypothetical protein
MVIIHKDVFAKFGNIQNMKVEKKKSKHPTMLWQW